MEINETLDALAELWRWERQADHERFVARRTSLTFKQRVAEGLALAELRVVGVGPAPGGLIRVTCEAAGLERSRVVQARDLLEPRKVLQPRARDPLASSQTQVSQCRELREVL